MIYGITLVQDMVKASIKTMQIAHAGKPSTLAGIKFAEFLAGDEMAFDNLYCVAFQMMDAQWLAKRASYMEFNVNSSLNVFMCALLLILVIVAHI